MNAIDKTPSPSMTPVKEMLGDAFTYGQIRMVKSHLELVCMRQANRRHHNGITNGHYDYRTMNSVNRYPLIVGAGRGFWVWFLLNELSLRKLCVFASLRLTCPHPHPHNG